MDLHTIKEVFVLYPVSHEFLPGWVTFSVSPEKVKNTVHLKKTKVKKKRNRTGEIVSQNSQPVHPEKGK